MVKLAFGVFAAAVTFEVAADVESESYQKRELAPAACPSGYCRVREMCFKVSDDAMNWDDAKAKCAEDGAQLATLTSQLDNEYILTLTTGMGSSELWIGANEIGETDGRYNWADGTGLGYTNWNTDTGAAPTEAVGDTNLQCSYVGKGGFDQAKWDVDQCTEEKRFACSKKAEPTFNDEDARCWSMEACPFPYHLYAQGCFRVSTDKKSRADAAAACAADGAGLAILKNVDETNNTLKLADALGESEGVWINANVNRTEGYFKGCYPSYSNWAKAAPLGETGDCVLVGKGGITDVEWNVAKCDTSMSFACSMAAKAPPGLQDPFGVAISTYAAPDDGRCCMDPRCDGETSKAFGAGLLPGFAAASLAAVLLQ